MGGQHGPVTSVPKRYMMVFMAETTEAEYDEARSDYQAKVAERGCAFIVRGDPQTMFLTSAAQSARALVQL